MNYIIYGINRVARDFLYIFDNLSIKYLTDNEISSHTQWGFDVYELQHALKDNCYDKIIVCDFEKGEKIKELQSLGLKYGKDYVLEEDFFFQLDDFSLPGNKPIAVWGTGNMAHKLMEDATDFMPDIFIDSNKSSEVFYERKVYFPDEIQLKDYYIVIAIAKSAEVRNVLENNHLKEYEDFCSFHTILGRPSEMLRKTIFDDKYYELECHTMLNHLEILNSGASRCCCTTFVAQDLDNILSKQSSDVWRSNLHKIMCLSIENRTYSFCDKNMCPLFVDKSSRKKAEKKSIDWDYKNMSDTPEVLALGYDPSCNLACTTCRKSTYFVQGNDKKTVDAITSLIKAEYLEKCKFLILAGDGEVFASPAYKAIYEDPKCNPEYIRLLTNGILFTPRNWAAFKANKTSKIMMTVSIDAATAESYEQIRCNGNFEVLKKNMEFASKLRKKGELSYLRFNFVVQKKNYLEMASFVKWGEKLGVDEIFFTKILNWGTYSKEEFAEISMMQEDEVTPKPELIEVLNDPIIKNSTIVDLGTIQYMHKLDEVNIVENYYKWELEKRGGKLFQ